MDVMTDLPGVGGVTRALKGTKVFHGIAGELIDLDASKTPPVRALFKKFDPATVGSGAGGDLYGKGIYLTTHRKIAESYANLKHPIERFRGMVRTHNIPPQAKILHVGEEEQRVLNTIPRADIPSTVRAMGYDGISYEAGKVVGLPPGVPKGTKNYVIYNYDIINNPRSLMPKAKPQPEKALRRFPSKRDKLLVERRKQAQKVAAERRRPTREEVEFLLKKRGMFAW